MIDALKARIHPDWRSSLKWGSVRLHAIATGLFAYIIANPNALNNLVYGIAPSWRYPVLFTVAGAWFVLGWVVRVWQGKPNG